MKIVLFFSVFLFMLSFPMTAQEFSIKGKLIDKTTKKPLEAATVFVEAVQDSSLVAYTISDSNGDFKLEGRTGLQKVNFVISFVGYASFTRELEIEDNRDQDLNQITLCPAVESLADILITARAPPILFKKDTVEFNTASFKTKADANVEDLLKELPGFEIDANGAITVNGKPVDKVLVNGKPFFGDDPTIATRNLTKEIVKKIQVVDTRTKTQAFTGEQSDGENKTINIRIDKDKNKGTFGRVSAGGGTDKRFQYAGLGNYFDNDLRLTVLVGGNNVNQTGFDFGEISNSFGRGSYYDLPGRNRGGITNSRVGGFNYADDWGKDTEVTSNYFYTAANNFEDQRSNAQNNLPDRTYFSESERSSRNQDDRHRAETEFETTIDSVLYVEVRPDFTYNESSGNSSNSQRTFNEARELTNESSGENNSKRFGRDFDNRTTVTRKYGTGGGFFRLNTSIDLSENQSTSSNKSKTLFYEEGSNGTEVKSSIIRDQRSLGDNSNGGFSGELEWNIPLIAEKFFLQLEYRYNQNTRNSKSYVFDRIDNATLNFNDEQSTDYTNKNRVGRPRTGLRYRSEKWNARANISYVMRTLASKERINEIDFENKFDAIEANVDLRYNFSKNTRISGGYRLDNSAPGVQELSPFVDVSNPLFITKGNPNLDPTNRHSIDLNFNDFNVSKEANFYVYANLDMTHNDVVRNSTIGEDLVRNTTFANVDGNYGFYGGFGYGRRYKLDSLNSIRVNLGGNYNLRNEVNFINDEQYDSKSNAIGPRISVDYSFKELIDFELSYNPGFSQTTFAIEDRGDINITTHRSSLKGNFDFGKLKFENVLNYNYNSNIAEGFQKGSLFWNSSINYNVLNDNGLISVKAYDLLNQNTDASRFTSGEAVVDTQTTILQRYFMLSFSYKFNTLGKKGNLSNERRGRRRYW